MQQPATGPQADGNAAEPAVPTAAIEYVLDGRLGNSHRTVCSAIDDLAVQRDRIAAGHGNPSELIAIAGRIADAAAQLTAAQNLKSLLPRR